MTLSNEEFIREAYQIAEDYDVPGWVARFTEDGTLTNYMTGETHRGSEVRLPVEMMKKAFPDIHRELHHVYVSDNVVVVQVSLQGTHNGPLETENGTIPPTGRRIDTPCCDVFELADGKIKRFDCYPAGSVMLAQLGLLGEPAGSSSR